MKKTIEAMVQKNLQLSAEFSRYLFEHPEIEGILPRDAEIVLLPEFDAKLRAYNRKMAVKWKSAEKRSCMSA